MITRRVKNLPFQNVAANSVASLELPLGPTYHEIILKLGGTFTHAHITGIRCKLNGKVFFEITGTYLDAITDYKGETTAATFLSIPFCELDAKTINGMYMGAIRTGPAAGVASFTIEVTIGAATSPTLESVSIVSANAKEPGSITAMFNHPQTYAAGGDYFITLPHGPNAQRVLKRAYFFHTGDMSALSVLKNGIEIFEDMSEAWAEYLTERRKKVWQTNLFVFDPIDLMDLASMVNMTDAYDLRFKISLDAADTVNVYAEYMGFLGQF